MSPGLKHGVRAGLGLYHEMRDIQVEGAGGVCMGTAR